MTNLYSYTTPISATNLGSNFSIFTMSRADLSQAKYDFDIRSQTWHLSDRVRLGLFLFFVEVLKFCCITATNVQLADTEVNDGTPFRYTYGRLEFKALWWLTTLSIHTWSCPQFLADVCSHMPVTFPARYVTLAGRTSLFFKFISFLSRCTIWIGHYMRCPMPLFYQVSNYFRHYYYYTYLKQIHQHFWIMG